MRECWAEVLGDCSEKLTREHIITEGVFLSPEVKVKGLAWCLDDFKVIGLTNLVRKNLCSFHNSSLSDTDIAAIDLRRAICDSLQLSDIRSNAAPQDWAIAEFSIDGRRLERWFLKTLLSDAFGGQFLISSTGVRPGEIPAPLVRAAFGHQPLGERRAGMYLMGAPGPAVEVREGVTFTTFTGKSGRLEGARFWFWGLRFVLVLDEVGLIAPFEFIDPDSGHVLKDSTIYRPCNLGVAVHGRHSHTIKFNW